MYYRYIVYHLYCILITQGWYCYYASIIHNISIITIIYPIYEFNLRSIGGLYKL